MRLFLVITLFSTFVWAQYSSPVPKEISGADIICQSAKEDLQVSVNTATGRIWAKAVSNKSNEGFETWGNVWTGIRSAEQYEGEVLSEITFNGVRMYTTLIMRQVSGKPEMSFEMYSVANGNDFRKATLKDCKLGN